jgi:fatty acid desaturase
VLDDHERETLREVERRLLADDPDFVSDFQARQSHLPRRTFRRGTIVAVVIAVLLVGLMLAAGSVGGAILWLVATAVVWGMWRHSTKNRRTR